MDGFFHVDVVSVGTVECTGIRSPFSSLLWPSCPSRTPTAAALSRRSLCLPPRATSPPCESLAPTLEAILLHRMRMRGLPDRAPFLPTPIHNDGSSKRQSKKSIGRKFSDRGEWDRGQESQGAPGGSGRGRLPRVACRVHGLGAASVPSREETQPMAIPTTVSQPMRRLGSPRQNPLAVSAHTMALSHPHGVV